MEIPGKAKEEGRFLASRHAATRALLSLCAARRLPHDGTLSTKIHGFAAAPGGFPDTLIRCTCWVADTTISLLFDFQI